MSSARATGALLALGSIAFGIAASILSAAFDWPDILREPASVVLPAYAEGGATLTWIWFATAWTYAILLVPMLLLPKVLGLQSSSAIRVATWVVAVSVVASLVGFLRWVFVVPQLAAAYVGGDEVVKAANDAAWVAQHQYGGALLGEHVGQVLVIAWSITLSVVILRTRVLPRWLGVVGIATSVLYLLNQGDVMATAIPGFPVSELAGLVGPTAWLLWVTALGVVVFMGRIRPVVPAEAALEPQSVGR
jgi:hypothetical protein